MTLRTSCLAITFIAALTACDGHSRTKDRIMPDLPNVKSNLAFTCAYEKDRIPPRDPEADQLYVHARWLRKNNLIKKDPLVFAQMERLNRIAAAYGHDLANFGLRQMLGQGTAISDDIVKETLDLTQNLIDRGIPGGYYDMGRYLERGYGVKQDKELALKYYRKSADLGSPIGQYSVGEKLFPIDVAPNIARQMWRCAAEQGYGEAGRFLGIDQAEEKNFVEALQALQLGAKAGDASSAGRLSKGFDGPPASDEMFYLGQQKDPERVRRYEAINNFLFDYDYLSPKVPEIDAIVPLPPAKLPKWDGTFQWLKAHEANVPPPLPTEERIREMAKAKNLDPDTGRPLKIKKAEVAPEAAPQLAAAPRLPLGTVLPSLQRCPQTGFWECAATPAVGSKRRFLLEGMRLPTAIVRGPERSLWQKLQGEPRNKLAETTWTLVGYDAPAAEETDRA